MVRNINKKTPNYALYILGETLEKLTETAVSGALGITLRIALKKYCKKIKKVVKNT